MSDEFDKELEELTREPTNVQKAMAMLTTICTLAREGRSKRSICDKLGLNYSLMCKAEKKNTVLYEAFRGIPPAQEPSPVVAYGRQLPDDPASAENLQKIQAWSRDGVSRSSMAALLKMTEEQLNGYVRNVPRIAEAIRLGEAEAEAAACAALAALVRDPEHKDHIRAVLAQAARSAAAKPKNEESDDELLTPEQISEALRKHTR